MATICTDSRYAFGVVHDFGTLWKQFFFFKNPTSKPVTDHQLISDLLNVILLPQQAAICKCEANHSDTVSLGNARVDAALLAYSTHLHFPLINCVPHNPQPRFLLHSTVYLEFVYFHE